MWEALSQRQPGRKVTAEDRHAERASHISCVVVLRRGTRNWTFVKCRTGLYGLRGKRGTVVRHGYGALPPLANSCGGVFLLAQSKAASRFTCRRSPKDASDPGHASLTRNRMT